LCVGVAERDGGADELGVAAGVETTTNGDVFGDAAAAKRRDPLTLELRDGVAAADRATVE
jgi:hypothetical protein